jgi:hypothetical protein
MKDIIFVGGLFLVILAGCQAVKYLGATPIQDTNNLSEKVEDLSKKTNLNVAKLGSSVTQLAEVNVVEAKADGDMNKVVEAVKTKVIAEQSTKQAEELSQEKLPRSEVASIDGTGIMGLIGSALGGNWMEVIFGLIAMATGGRAIQLQTKNKRLVEKGRKFATTPETFDISNDKDLS